MEDNGSGQLGEQRSQEPALPASPHARRRRTEKSQVIEAAARAVLTQDYDLDATQPGWWQPQPRATIDPEDKQDRPCAPLARCLSCCLCHELLREPMTSPECGHTYCYDCIEARVEIGGNHNVCPGAGCEVVLGPTPFDHHRLMYDSLLDALVQKVFPRPQLDAALNARRMEREAAVRQARAAVNTARGGAARSGGGPSSSAMDDGGDEEEGEEEEEPGGQGQEEGAAGLRKAGSGGGSAAEEGQERQGGRGASKRGGVRR